MTAVTMVYVMEEKEVDESTGIAAADENQGEEETNNNAMFQLDCSSASDGFYRYPYDCSKYIQCVHGQQYINQCAPSLEFNINTNQCDWPHNVDCTAKVNTATTTTPASAVITNKTPTKSLTKYKLVCYYTNWSQYRNGAGKFFPKDIDPHLCTHIIYAFGKLVGNQVTNFEWNDNDPYNNLYAQVNAHKQQNPKLKTLLAMGGWTAGSLIYSNMASTAANRKEFIDSSIAWLRKYNFDGLDMDWEYPANRDGKAYDKVNFAHLCKETREAFDREAAATGKERLLFTSAVGAGKSVIDTAYDVPVMAQYMDFICLMTYDLHGSWESSTGLHTGLYASNNDPDKTLNVAFAANYWHQKGAPKDKLIIGLGTYGRSFTLVDAAKHGVGAPASGAGVPGPYTREKGFLSYYEICEMQKSGQGTTFWDPVAKVPYFVNPSTKLWVGFDDKPSLNTKITELIVKDGYGGAMTWALPLDDFKGTICGEGRYPLISAMRETLVAAEEGRTINYTTSATNNLVTTQSPSATTASSGGQSGFSSKYKMVCYYTNWSQYRNGVGKYFPKDIDPHLCTHIIYAFGKLVGNQVTNFEWNDNDPYNNLYAQVNAHKQQNPKLKTLLAMGGWTAGSLIYSNMASTAANRKEFIDSSIAWLRKYNFDGLDMDWEYPANRDGKAYDKVNFALLCKETRAAFDREAAATGKERLLFTSAVGAGKSVIDTAYDVPVMAQTMDFICLMTYDLHGSWESFTGLHTGLYASNNDSDKNLNVAFAAEYWHQKGAPRDKLIIGLGTYGRSFTLVDAAKHWVGAPASGAGVPGPYTREKGFLSYYEICEMQRSGKGTTYVDPVAKVPYFVNPSTKLWVGFDDKASLYTKINDLIIKDGYGGAMTWSLALDDFTGTICGEGKYPLISLMKKTLEANGTNGPVIRTPYTTSNSSVTQSPSLTTAKGGGADVDCSKLPDGFYRHPSDCSKFIQCAGGRSFEKDCGLSLRFNSNTKSCDWPANVDCSLPVLAETTTTTQATSGGKQTLSPSSSSSDGSKKLVCYYTNWSQYRNGAGKFFPKDIDPHLCTHIIYAFGKLVGNKITNFEWNDNDPYNNLYEQVNAHKQQNPKLKTLLAMGGWTAGSLIYSNMASTAANRKEFIDSAISWLRRYNFDGLDMDWEYPANRDGKPYDKVNFAHLCKETREAFDREAAATGKERLLFTSAVGAGKSVIDTAYDVPVMAKYMDFICLMTYDLHGSWESSTGLHTGLYASNNDPDKNLNVAFAAEYWHQKGAPREKLIIGLGTYGRSFTLVDASKHGVGAPASGAGTPGPYTREKGFLSYYEICEMQKSGQGTTYRDPVAKVPYYVNPSTKLWVGFDDKESLATKVTELIIKHGYGGAMIWSLPLDDFKGTICGEGKYPLVSLIKTELAKAPVGSTDGSVIIPPAKTTTGDESGPGKYKLVCYYTNWSQYRNGAGKFFPKDIDPQLCTHIIYAFGKLVGNQVTNFEWNDNDPYNNLYEQVNAHKQQNPKLKTLLAMGGWTAGSLIYSNMASTAANRKEFIDSSISWLRKYNFDGLDMDWEYPANRDGKPYDKVNFAHLCKETREAFDREAAATGKERLLFTSAVGAGKSVIDTAYDVPVMAKYMDFICLMTYDLHGSWEKFTGLHTGLYASNNDSDKNLNVAFAANYWHQLGVPREKLIVGLGTYGRSFTLVDAANHGVGAPVSGAGTPGLYTREKGFLSYYEICEMQKSGQGTTYRDPVAKVPYYVNPSTKLWVGFDDKQSLYTKVHELIIKNGYGGAMIWSLPLDDFKGTICGEGKYPLINSIKIELDNADIPPLVKTTSSSVTTKGGESGSSEYKLVCYYTNWSQYRNGAGKFFPKDIEPDLCTHIIYAFGKLVGNKITNFEWNDNDQYINLYAQVNAHKLKNPKLKTLLAMGGWTAGSLIYSNMASTAANRKEFIDSSISWLRKYNFDGLDMDWEYPANRDGKPYDKENFALLCKETREAFDREAAATGKERLLFTSAVGAGKSVIDTAYDVPVMAKYMDFICLMTYDLHGSWEKFTGLHTGLYASKNDSDKNLNVAFAANYWHQLGVPREKLIVGLGTYGRSFTLVDAANHGVGAPVSGAGTPGRYTREKGFLSYYEICEMQKSGQGTTYRDPVAKVPYYVNPVTKLWVGFDDKESLYTKLSELIIKDGYGGAMIWSLALDDFKGTMCGEGTYPLISMIKEELETANERKLLETTTKPPALPNLPIDEIPTEVDCSKSPDGNYGNPFDCSQYFQCVNGRRYRQSCPPSLQFNVKTKLCDWPYNANCVPVLTTASPEAGHLSAGSRAMPHILLIILQCLIFLYLRP